MLRDYAVSMTLILFVLLGYTALLFWKKNENPAATAGRTDARAEASLATPNAPTGTINATTEDGAGAIVEHN